MKKTLKYKFQSKNFLVSSNDFSVSLLFDKEDRIRSVKNHVMNDDYFGSLATMIDLLRQEIKGVGNLQKDILSNLKDDINSLGERPEYYFYVQPLLKSIGILEEEINSLSLRQGKFIKEIKDDLIFLHEEYKIVKKNAICFCKKDE